jgi:aspartate-semialdehyde dehydrogenase
MTPTPFLNLRHKTEPEPGCPPQWLPDLDASGVMLNGPRDIPRFAAGPLAGKRKVDETAIAYAAANALQHRIEADHKQGIVTVVVDLSTLESWKNPYAPAVRIGFNDPALLNDSDSVARAIDWIAGQLTKPPLTAPYTWRWPSRLSAMNTIALIGSETLLGADVREALALRVPGARVKLTGSQDETILTEEEGEAVVMTSLDEETIAEAAAVVLAGSAESARRAFAIIERSTRRPPIVDLSGALEDRPEARLRAPSVDGGTKFAPAPVQVVAHPAAIVLARVLRAAKGAGRAVVTILAPASERGRAGVEELRLQTVQLLSFQNLTQDVFGAQLSFNLLAGGCGDAERAIERHLASLLSFGPPVPMPSIRVIQAPVMHGYGISLWIEGAGDFNREGLDLRVDAAPTPVGAAGEEGISIGAMERDRNHASAIWMWVVADQFRIAARDAADIVRELV